PSTVDVAAFRMMGLAVVARLASRYNIRVELRRNAEGGTVANVALPSGILVLPKIRGREPMVTRPRMPLAVEPAPAYPARGWPAQAVPESAVRGWPPAPEPAVGRPAVSIGLHVTGAAASSAAAASSTSMPMAGLHTTVAAGAAANHYGTGTPRQVYPDDTTELPIFREMEAVWFRTHGSLSTQQWAAEPAVVRPTSAPPGVTVVPPASAPPYVSPYVPSDGYAAATPSAARGVPAGAEPPPAVPRPRGSEDWRTAADTGWQAASAAADPRTGGSTRSGLPKRVPMDQLVPGGVDESTVQNRSRRTPEEVRGLLSAYHRGVQRGRAGGDLSKLVEPEGYRGSST
ncbi:MAG TPA: ATPase, partial [Micromonosporaceae bacterium]|nr:ATPase [Micromonosporaceae bacterium]